ncbi:MAG TPA: alpha/beta hydrolase [Thermoleophilaceae bacterium]|nr:alpha/beta hydrolase [Thermoleophilaceae bacterium]
MTPPVVLVHAGICDNRMWDRLAAELGSTYAPVRHELRGFGNTPLPAEGRVSNTADLAASIEQPSVLVGASYGGQVCLELAAERPELVLGLVLLAAVIPCHDWSSEAEAFFEEEERLLEAGDVDAATELNVSFWAGTAERSVKKLVGEMQRRAFELQLGSAAEVTEPERIELGSITAPTLVVTGDRDIDDFKRMADRLVAGLLSAKRATIAGAGHLPALERPRETAELLADFLEQLA